MNYAIGARKRDINPVTAGWVIVAGLQRSAGVKIAGAGLLRELKNLFLIKRIQWLILASSVKLHRTANKQINSCWCCDIRDNNHPVHRRIYIFLWHSGWTRLLWRWCHWLTSQYWSVHASTQTVWHVISFWMFSLLQCQKQPNRCCCLNCRNRIKRHICPRKNIFLTFLHWR